MYNLGHTLAQSGTSDALASALGWFRAAAAAGPDTAVGRNAHTAVAHVEATPSNTIGGGSGQTTNTRSSARSEKNGLAVIDVLLSPYSSEGETPLQTLLKLKKSGKLTNKLMKQIERAS